MSIIRTYTGKNFNLKDPDPNQVDIEDIAHALSNLCRFTGHTKFFYSVAQHSLLVSKMLLRDGYSHEVALYGLLHDATEAYIGDIASPLKNLIPVYKKIERRIEKTIAKKFNLNWRVARAIIKEYDLMALNTERRDLMGNPNWGMKLVGIFNRKTKHSPPNVSKRNFLDWYNYLQEKIAE